MTGSYIGLFTIFLLDNANQIPLLNRLPPLTLWFIPSIIGIPFLFRSLSHYTPKRDLYRKRVGSVPQKEVN
jgi:hypothetical protein